MLLVAFAGVSRVPSSMCDAVRLGASCTRGADGKLKIEKNIVVPDGRRLRLCKGHAQTWRRKEEKEAGAGTRWIVTGLHLVEKGEGGGDSDDSDSHVNRARFLEHLHPCPHPSAASSLCASI